MGGSYIVRKCLRFIHKYGRQNKISKLKVTFLDKNQERILIRQNFLFV